MKPRGGRMREGDVPSPVYLRADIPLYGKGGSFGFWTSNSVGFDAFWIARRCHSIHS